MNIESALKIDGWMEPKELKWLAYQASCHNLIVEVGSFLGRSTRVLADNTQGTVVAIDDFYGPREYQIGYWERRKIRKKFEFNLRDHIGSGRVVVLDQDHSVIPVNGERPDMVFIDGSHEYADVKRDILNWSERLQLGGLLCGHDYSENWPGVIQAVNELVPNFRLVEGTYIWHRP